MRPNIHSCIKRNGCNQQTTTSARKNELDRPDLLTADLNHTETVTPC